MAKTTRWRGVAALLWLGACSELKPGVWVPDGAPATDAAGAPDAACPRDLARCDDRCVNLREDRLHCGRCGARCDDEDEQCQGGRCR